jgi:hypothetical protein
MLLIPAARSVGTDESDWDISSARDRFITLVSKRHSISDVSATLFTTIPVSGGQGLETDKQLYYYFPPDDLTRIESLEWTRADDRSITNTAYAYLINPRERRVYVQRGEGLALLDDASSEQWISCAQLLTARHDWGSDHGTEIYYVGRETIDHHPTDSFLFVEKFQVKGKLSVGVEDGLVYRGQGPNLSYELRDVKVNMRLKKDFFTIDKKVEHVPHISDKELGAWWAKGRLPKSEERSKAESLTIHTAIWAGNLKAVKEFLATNPQLVSAKEEHGWTPLHLAAMVGHKELVTLLLGSGAEVNAKDTRERTALFFAALHGKKDVVSLLMEHKAVVNVRDKESGLTPLLGAVMGGYGEIVELLLKNGADWTVKDSSGLTALQTAARFGHTDVAELLRRYGETE